MRSHIVRLVILFIIFSLNLAPSLLAAEPPTDIPFTLYGGFAVIVRGAIGNQRNLSILVDTGAVPSVVDQRLARRLKLNGPAERISVVNQNLSLERVSLAGLRLASVEFPAVSAVVLDLAAIETRLGLRLDAIIGLDVLGRQNFTIDYRHRRILLGEAVATGEPIPFELETEAGTPYVVVSMQMNDRQVRLLLDTGANNLTLYLPRVRALGVAISQEGARTDLGAAGEYAVRQIRISNVRLGKMKRASLAAAMVNSSDSALRDFDGLLGPSALGLTQLAFDFDHRILYILPGQ